MRGEPDSGLAARQLLARPLPEFLAEAAARFPRGPWTLEAGPTLLYDRSGVDLLAAILRAYRGGARELRFQLDLEPDTARDYYSLGPDATEPLPLVARRESGAGVETLAVKLPTTATLLDTPASLAPKTIVRTPLALLKSHHGDFDLLLADQIALFSALAREAPRAPSAWLRALFGRGPWPRRLARAWRAIHPTADVHPTAVIEGSVVEAGARVGAHCVVRFSRIGPRAQLFDGAKVEFSTVGSGSWLMHDLVLFRSHVESDVFLIHGPYQFSSFESRSAAFATIMMDYRPDGRPIKAPTRSGLASYRGRFLGAVLKEGAKALGGTLLPPGIVVPPEAWPSAAPAALHRAGRIEWPRNAPAPPAA